jgi:hypothetical protein
MAVFPCRAAFADGTSQNEPDDSFVYLCHEAQLRIALVQRDDLKLIPRAVQVRHPLSPEKLFTEVKNRGKVINLHLTDGDSMGFFPLSQIPRYVHWNIVLTSPFALFEQALITTNLLYQIFAMDGRFPPQRKRREPLAPLLSGIAGSA